MARKIEIIIAGDSSGASKAFSEVGRKSQQELGKSEASGKKWASGFGQNFDQVGGRGKQWAAGIRSNFDQVGIGSALGGAALAKFGFDAVKAYSESAKVGAQTNAVILSTGSAANVTADEVSGLASAISKKTGVDDEAIQSGQNMLLTFTNVKNEVGEGNDIFNQATHTLVDMAAAMGTDAKSEAIKLGKALNDPIKGITALTKVGVTFTDQQKEQIKALVQNGKTMEAQKIILAELNKEFGGSAEAIATPFDKLTVTLGNLQEVIGSQLAPQAEAFANALSLVAVGSSDAAEGGTNYGRVMRGVLTLGASEIPGLKNIWGSVEEATGGAAKVTEDYQTAQRDVADLLADGKKGTDEYNEAQGRLNTAKGQADKLTRGLTEATNEGVVSDEAAAAAKKKHEDATKKAEAALNSYRNAVTGTRDAQRDQFASAIELTEALGEFKKETDEARFAGGKNAQQNLEAAQAYNRAGAAIDDVGEKAVETAKRQRELQGKTLGAKDAAIVQRDAYIKLRDQIAPGSPMRTYLEGLIRDMDNAARNRTGTLTVNVKVSDNAILNRVDGRASGGTVRKNQPYIVGERRPELFVPDQNGTILPSVPTSRGGATSGGNTYYISVSGVLDGRGAADAIKRVLNDDARLNGRTPQFV